jgi:H+-transporting ATPase
MMMDRLGAAEDAAGMSILCSDKTGTLTKNELTVKEVITADGVSQVEVLQTAALSSQIANAGMVASMYPVYLLRLSG